MGKKAFVTEANLRDQKNPEGLPFSAEIVMAISHYFLPTDRVVVEKTAKIRGVR